MRSNERKISFQGLDYGFMASNYAFSIDNKIDTQLSKAMELTKTTNLSKIPQTTLIS